MKSKIVKTPSAEFTIAGLLARLQRGKVRIGNPETAKRQLRHFANHGLLRPIGIVHTGTGKNRTFGPDEIVRAGLLLALSRAQLTVGLLAACMDRLDAEIRSEKAKSLVEVGDRIENACIGFTVRIGDDDEAQVSVSLIDARKTTVLDMPNLTILVHLADLIKKLDF